MSYGSGDFTDAALSGDVAVFSAYLRTAGMDFLVLEETGAQARVRFVGRFQGEEVVWDCRFVTLHEAQRRRHHPGMPSGQRLRNFIDIGPRGPTGVALRVGLDIDRIDKPAIVKMIVMIRNYKRLQPGRHEFGDAG